MSKYFYILTAIAILTMMTACSDDNDYEVETSAISIVSGEDLNLVAAGETKTFTTNVAVASATAADSWLTVSASGTTVSVTAEANSNLTSRHTLVTVTEAGGDYTTINVSQYGGVVNLGIDSYDLSFDDEARTVSYKATATLPVEIESGSSWITAELTTTTFTLSLEENATGLPRVGYVYITSMGTTETLTITQWAVQDVIGDYTMYYYSSASDGTLKSIECTLGTDMAMSFPSLGLSVPMIYDEDDHTLTVTFGDYLGTYGSYYIYLMVGDAYNYVSYNSGYTASSQLYLDSDGALCGDTFEGVWGSRNVDRLIFRKMTAQSFAKANNAGILIQFWYPYLKKS